MAYETRKKTVMRQVEVIEHTLELTVADLLEVLNRSHARAPIPMHARVSPTPEHVSDCNRLSDVCVTVTWEEEVP